MANLNLPPWYIWAISVVLPALDALIIQAKWNRQIKSLVAFAVAVGVAFVAVWVTGALNWQNLVTTITVVFTVSQIIYDQYFKNVIQKKEQHKITNI